MDFYNFKRKENLENYIRKLENKKYIQSLIDKRISTNVLNDVGKNMQTIKAEIYRTVYAKVEELSKELLKLEPNSIWAKERLMKSLFISEKSEEFENEAQEILEIDEENKLALWYMSKEKRKKNDIYGEKEYLEKMILTSNGMTNVKVLKRVEEVNNLIEQKEKKEEVKKLEQIECNEEERKAFIAKMQEDFINGKIAKGDISRYKEDAKNYPNYFESLKAILDIEAKITGNLQNKILGFRAYLSIALPEELLKIYDEIENTEKQIEIEKSINKVFEEKYKVETKEQRKYSMELIKRLEQGKVEKEELPKITRELEKFKDRDRAIFLIVKIYEIFYGKEEAIKQLKKYIKFFDLTKFEKKEYEEFDKKIGLENKKGKTNKLKKIYGVFEEKKVKYNRRVEDATIKEIQNMIKEGKTVIEIHNIKSDISIKRISIIRGKYIKKDEEFLKRQEQIEKYAYNLLNGGKELVEVYKLFEGDIPKSKLNIMKKRLGEQELKNEGEDRDE